MENFNEMKTLLDMVDKEFNKRFLFNPNALFEDASLLLKHPTKNNFILIEKEGELFEITIFLNKNDFMLSTQTKCLIDCIEIIRRCEFLLEAVPMDLNTCDGVKNCICVEVTCRGDC